MSINPEQKPYLKLTPLRMQCLTNFPFIEADFDALTDYQLFCEIVKYLNNVIKNEQIVTDNVIALYDAFMQLQEEVEHELAEQNQRIDDYFENTNIQTFVDNKINEMIETNEFQTLLAEAILEINPDALKDEKRINVLDFGDDLQTSGVYNSFRDDVFLDDGTTGNKNKVISILNQMLSSDATKYYFINSSDDILINRLYCIELDSLNNTYNVIIYYDLHYVNENNPEVRYSTQFNYTLIDNVVTNTAYDNSYSDKTYYTGNGGSGGSDTPIYYITDATSIPNFTTGSYTISETDKPKYINILTDALSKNYKVIILYLSSGNSQFLLYLDINSIDLNSTSSTFTISQFYNSMRADSIRAIAYNGSTNKVCSYITIQVSISAGVIIDITPLSDSKNIDKYLGINNTFSYTPTSDYHPSTKKYTDDNDIEALDLVIPGFLTDHYATYDTQFSNNKNNVIALRYKDKTQAFYSTGMFNMKTNSQFTGQIILGYVSNDVGLFGITSFTPQSNGLIGDVALGFVNLSGSYKIYPIQFIWDSTEQKYAMTIDFGSDTIPADTYVLVKIDISRTPLTLN